MDSAASSPASTTSSRVARNLFHMSPVKHYSYNTDSDECATPLRLSSPEISPDKPRFSQRACRRNLLNNSPSVGNSPVLRLTSLEDGDFQNGSPLRRSPRNNEVSTSALMTPFKGLVKPNTMVIEESPDVVTTTPQNKKPPSKQSSISQFYSPSSGISVGSFYSTGKPKARLSLFTSSSFVAPRPVKRSRSATGDSRNRVKRTKVDGPRLGNCRSGVAFKKHKRAEPSKKIPTVSPQDRMDLAEIDQVMAEINRPKLAPIALNVGTKRARPTEPPAAVLKSPEVDPKKKFFKTNRTMEVNRTATVTIDRSMRFEVSNGKFTLQKAKRGPRALFAPTGIKICTERVQRKVEAIIESLGGATDGATDGAVLPVKAAACGDLVPLPPTPPKLTTPPPVSPLSSPDTKMAAITSSTSKMALGEGAGVGQDAGLFALFYKGFQAPKETSPQSPRGQRAAKRGYVPTPAGQMQIDAGQRRFGHTLCAGCNLLYQMGEPEEEQRHQEYHRRHFSIKFMGWKQEHVANLYDDDDGSGAARVVAVTAADPKPWWRKVDQVMEAVDEEIGSAPQPINELPSVKVLLYVAGDRVVGCIVGQALRSANRILPAIDGLQCCSEETHPVVMGIYRVWVAQDWRRRKVASRLVDSLRSTYVYGAVLSMNDFAFSVPTEAGAAFAQKYTGVEDYLVYS